MTNITTTKLYGGGGRSPWDDGIFSTTFLSSFCQALLDRLASHKLLDVFHGANLDSLLKRLERILLTASSVFNDAEVEQKEDLVSRIRDWLHKLTDVFYQAEDVVDEISSPSPLDKGIEYKMKHIIQQLEDLMNHKDMMRQRKLSKTFQRLPTTPLLDNSDQVFGRDDDKEALVNLLLSDDVDGNNLTVIPIVGMAGVGKTTLVQLVYNDCRVKEHFDLKAWVSVGVEDDTDVPKMMKAALEALTPQPCNVQDLHSLQGGLKKCLAGKKYLLILDDVWSENDSDWEILQAPLSSGSRGSKIVVTTRSHVVASIMKTVLSSYDLKSLAEEDCWKLFTKLAFGNKQLGSHPELENIGREIVRKCNGLPLAAKFVAGHLCLKPIFEEWNTVLKNNGFGLPRYMSGVLPALELSYDPLPAHLKLCFAYCSIFPKGYEFEREKLVLLWMAEGLLQPNSNKRLEDIGDDYFHGLFSRSFFQQSTGNKSCFVMHSIMNDFAKFVSGEFCFRLEDNVTSQISDKARHFSVFRCELDVKKVLESIYAAKYLRTLLPFELRLDSESCQLSNKLLHDLFSTLRCLRVLCLSHYHITRLPESIGNLKHLRYLDLSNTSIKKLPDHVCTLHNLQTLLLSNCHSLTDLPTNMWNLINLRYLDLDGTSLKEMPIKLNGLKSLQMLSNFIVGRCGSRINELGELLNLHGTLCISELQNVDFATESNESILKEKQYLDGLVLAWCADTVDTNNQREVLEMLQPHPNLKTLRIMSYSGERFPNWLGDFSFSNMVFLRLTDCKYCSSLPRLGQLPSLKELIIEKADGVKRVGHEFYAIHLSQILPFRSLENLMFDEMARWDEWVSPEVEGGAFPRLQKLCIKNCPKLIRNLPNNLPFFTEVIVSHCPLFEATLPVLPVIDVLEEQENDETLGPTLTAVPATDVQLPDSNNMQFTSDKQLTATVQTNPVKDESQLHEESDNKVHPKSDDMTLVALPRCSVTEGYEAETHSEILKVSEFSAESYSFIASKSLYIRDPRDLVFIQSAQMMHQYSLLEYLCILGSCDSLQSFPLAFFPNLKSLSICDCENFSSISVPEGLEEDSISLEALEIRDCPNLVSLPEVGLQNMTSILLSNCKNLKALPEQFHMLSSLQSLIINECPELVEIPGGFPSNLVTLCITYCDKLTPRMEWRLHKLENLHCFEIAGGCKEVESFPEEKLLPQNLYSLCISEFLNLKSLHRKGLQHLTSLATLEIRSCNKLLSLPDEGLPSSLAFLCINDCSLLKAKLQNKGNDWFKIAHIPNIQIDEEMIS